MYNHYFFVENVGDSYTTRLWPDDILACRWNMWNEWKKKISYFTCSEPYQCWVMPIQDAIQSARRGIFFQEPEVNSAIMNGR
jgi:hypothetical protein